MPPAPFLAAFMEQVKPVHDRIASNVRQNRSLAVMRDALLPKLVTGEVRVPDAERIVGRCV